MYNIFRNIKKTDIFLVIICALISFISIFLLYSITDSFPVNRKIVIVHVVVSIIGIVLSLIISSIDYHIIANLWKIYIPASLFLVMLTFFFGYTRLGADDKAWIMLPFGRSFQPSEFMKITFILSLALHISSVHDEINKFKNIILLLIHGAIPIIIIHLQGDDGTALIFVIIFISMIFCTGISWKFIMGGLGAAITLSPIIWRILNQDQKNRIFTTFHPELDPNGYGYQQFNGLISIGNGGLTGKGLLSDRFTYVPEVHNDFIFSFIGQAFGYIGTVIILILLAIISTRILFNSLKASDYLGKFICVGVFGMITSQIILNIGMNLSILPVVGITLPLLSSGGSSILTIYIGIGLVLSVFTLNNKSIFYKRGL